MLQENPLISIIVAVYNGENTIQRCINSVHKQTYKNKELIIIDGNSSDKTLEIIKNNEEKIDFFVSEPDYGIADAWNKGIKKSKGDWILFLGCDDELYSEDSLEKLSPYLNHQYDIVTGKIQLIDNKGNGIKVLGDKWNWSKFRTKMSIPHQATLHSKKLFEEFGLFDPNFKLVADYELLLRKKDKLKALFIDQIISNMQIGGVSQREVIKVWKEWSQAQKKHEVMHNLLISILLKWRTLKYYIKTY